MQPSPLFRAACVLLALYTASGPVLSAWPQVPPAATDSATPARTGAAALDDARERIKTGDYDGAITVLKSAIDQSQAQPEPRREAYLLLIKTHVFQGNDFKFKPQGRTASDLSYAEARRLTVECLSDADLRHTRPEPETEFPPEMVRLFDDVRREIFGGVRVRGVSPTGALVYLDGDTLRVLPGEEALGATDIPAGIHIVTVERDGYETFTDRIVIAPNSTIERSYALVKRRGTSWYATRVGLGLAVAGGLAFAFLSGGDESSETPPEPLPGPPPPPAAPGR